MTAIDVGRGDALLLTYPNGQHVLVDAGESSAAQKYVIPYLISHGITSLDAIVCTHEHSDHLNGLVELLKDGRVTVGAAYDTGFPIATTIKTDQTKTMRAWIDTYRAQLNAKHIKHTIVKAGDRIPIGNDNDKQQTYVLSPTSGLTESLLTNLKQKNVDLHAAINEDSIVLRVNYNDVRYLLAGDTGLPGKFYADQRMGFVVNAKGEVKENDQVKADVLKLGHHGFNPVDRAFYSVVNPRYVVITFGPLMTSNPPTTCEIKTFKGPEYYNYFKSEFKKVVGISNTSDKGNILVSTDGTSSGTHVATFPSAVPHSVCSAK